MTARRAGLVDPALAEAELVAGLRDVLGQALAAAERGAADVAADLIRERYQLALTLDAAEAAWQGTGGPEGPEVFAEHLDGLQEAADMAGSPSLVLATESLSLLVANGQADVAASVLAEAAAPIRQRLAGGEKRPEVEVE